MKILFLNPRFRDFVIEKNINQLYDHGIDSKGKQLQSASLSAILNDTVYAAQTIIEKELKGQPTDRVTLNDTGEFYDSFRLVLSDGGRSLKITANTLKDDNDLIQVWGPDILGLTDENLEKAIEFAKKILVPEVRRQILKAA